MTAPPTTSDAWWIFTYARLTPTTAARLIHSGAQRRPSHAISVAAAKAAALACPLGKADVLG